MDNIIQTAGFLFIVIGGLSAVGVICGCALCYLNDWLKQIQANRNTADLRRINSIYDMEQAISDNDILSTQAAKKLNDYKP
jgi:hypothetical protein